MLVLWDRFLVGGVYRDGAPEDDVLQVSSYVEVDLHYQLSVAKRMNTKPWDSVTRSHAKVSDVVLLPLV